jgi:hypothetical protein
MKYNTPINQLTALHSQTTKELKMKKRGRPDVFQREYGESGSSFRTMFAPDSNEYDTKRTAANRLYITQACAIITEAASEINYHELLFNAQSEKMHCYGVLEQLGRMYRQDVYSKEDVVEITKIAAELRFSGCKSRDIENYIRNGRKTNEWGI